MEETHSYPIPLWRILLSIFALILTLLLSTILVCVTNTECRSRIPTLGHLLDSSYVSPFVVTAMNSALSLHLVVSAGIYYVTMEAAYIACRVQMVASILVYVSIVITLFVFPFTDLDRNWANLTILTTLTFWMVCVVFSLRKHYKYTTRWGLKRVVTTQGVVWVFFVLSCIGYVVSRIVCPLCLVIFEGLIGTTVLVFLGLSMVHLWNRLSIQVIVS